MKTLIGIQLHDIKFCNTAVTVLYLCPEDYLDKGTSTMHKEILQIT